MKDGTERRLARVERILLKLVPSHRAMQRMLGHVVQEQGRMRHEQERMRQEQERMRQEQERMRQEQERMHQEQERMHQEQERMHQEQERMRQELRKTNKLLEALPGEMARATGQVIAKEIARLEAKIDAIFRYILGKGNGQPGK